MDRGFTQGPQILAVEKVPLRLGCEKDGTRGLGVDLGRALLSFVGFKSDCSQHRVGRILYLLYHEQSISTPSH